MQVHRGILNHYLSANSRVLKSKHKGMLRKTLNSPEPSLLRPKHPLPGRRMCGESNMQLMDAAAAAAVPRFAFISVHDYGFPGEP